jgi:hypothetical protein
LDHDPDPDAASVRANQKPSEKVIISVVNTVEELQQDFESFCKIF